MADKKAGELMAERIRGLSISLDLDTLGVDRGLKDLKRSFRTFDSSMRTNMNNFRNSEKSVKNYETVIGDLTDTIDNQKANLKDLRKEHDAVAEAEGAHSESAQKLRTEINKQADNINYYEHQLGKVTKEYEEFQYQQDLANNKFTKFGNSLSNFGGRLTSVGSSMKGLGDNLTRSITTPIVGATTAALGLTAALGWKRLVGIDNARAQLKGMGYDTEAVGRITDQVSEAVQGGMMTVAEGTSAAAGALAAGVKEGDELNRYLKLIDAGAVGMNRSVSETAMIFNRVQGSGKLMTQELNMIEESMPGFSSQLAEHLGVAPEAMREMVTAGEVTSDDFLNVMEGMAGGMAEAYSDTWSGMIQNTLANIGILGQNLLGGVFEQSKDSIREFLGLLRSDEVRNWATEAGEKLGQVFTNIVDKVRTGIAWFNNLSDTQKKLFGSLALGVVAAGPVLAVFGRLAMAAGTLITAYGPLFVTLGKMWVNFKKVRAGAMAFGAAFPKLATFIGILTGPIGITIGVITALGTAFVIAYKKSETFRNFADGIKDKFLSAIEWIGQFKDGIIGLFQDDGMAGVDILTSIGISQEMADKLWEFTGHFIEFYHNVKEQIDKVKTAFKGIFDIFTGNAVSGMELLRSIGLSDETIVNVMTFVGKVKGAFFEMRYRITEALLGVKDFFVQQFENIKSWWDTDGAMIFDAIGIVVKNVFDGIKFAVDFALKFVVELFNTFAPIVMGIWNVLWPTLQAVASTTWEQIKLVIGIAMDLIQGIISGISALITGDWERFGEILKETASSIWTRVTEFFTNMKENALTLFGELFSGAVQWFVDMYENLKQRAEFIKTVVVYAFNKLKDQAIEKVVGMFNSVVQWFVDMYENLKARAEYIKTVVVYSFTALKNEAINRIVEMYNSIKQWFSNLWTNVTNKAMSLKNTVVSRFTELKNNVVNRVSNLYSGVTNYFKNLWTNLTDRVLNIKNNIANRFDEMKEAVTGTASDLWTSVKETFNNMKDGLDEIIDKIKEKIGGMTDKVKEGINALIDGINWVAGKIGMDELPKIALSTGTQQINRNVSTTYDGKLKDGTFATVGDKGPGNGPGGFRQELIQYPNGKTALTPAKDTFTYLPKGSRVINGRDTYNLLNTPRFSMGTKLKGFGEAVGNKASEIGSAVKDAGSKAISAIGDVFDYIKNPGKLVDLVFKQFGFNFDFAEGSLIKDLLSSAYSKIKESVKNLFTSWLDMGGSGGDGSSFTKFPVTTPYSPNSPVPGYPRNINNGHHYGIDYATPSGTTLTAPTDGTLKQLRDVGGGIVARLINGQFTQFFMHLSTVLGSGKIKQGQPFARTGNSGKWTTGAHLHYQVEKGHSAYVTNKNTVDPDQFLRGITGGGAAATGSFRPQIAKALQLNGLPANKAYIDAWSRQVQSESSGNPRAVQRVIDINSGGNEARGLVQVIPPTFNAYKHPGMNDIYNPLHNLAAGINYAKNRYGKSGMLSVIGKGHGYENGGILQKAGLFLGAEGNKEEAVIPLHKPTEAMKLLAIVGKKLAGKGKKTSQLPNVATSNGNEEVVAKLAEMIGNQQQQIEQMNQAIKVLLGIEDKSGFDPNKAQKSMNKFNNRRTIMT